MNRTDSPSKQSKPFGINGQREPLLPTTPSGDNTASYELGFPPITMTLKSAGGLPPKGQDMNQILFELSSLCRWSSSGAINAYDSTFSSEIGGYPSGSMLISDDGLNIYINTVDGNTTNPNSGGGGWKSLIEYLKMNYGSPSIGVPFFWPSAEMPNIVISEWSDMVFLKFNGSSFSASSYPKLALVFPGLVLPDCRGEFPRIWDDGRGIDAGRSLLSAQRESMIRNSLIDYFGVDGTSAGAAMGIAVASFDSKTTTQPANAVAPDGQTPLLGVSADNGFTGSQSNIPSFSSNWSGVRPRNIAFNLLVRAK